MKTHFSYKRSPVTETLHFAIPARSKIRQFNEITVQFRTGIEHILLGPKIAVRQFELVPR